MTVELPVVSGLRIDSLLSQGSLKVARAERVDVKLSPKTMIPGEKSVIQPQLSAERYGVEPPVGRINGVHQTLEGMELPVAVCICPHSWRAVIRASGDIYAFCLELFSRENCITPHRHGRFRSRRRGIN